jgi:S1-C subfamily serine protease
VGDSAVRWPVMSAPQPDARPDDRPVAHPVGAPPTRGPRGRETRLLLATIAISVAVLVLLARFRFPDEVGRPVAEPVQAPLERLAARATFDELAAIMADLERRLLPRLLVVQVQPDRATGPYGVAARVTPNRAVALLAWHETLTGPAAPAILARDNARDLAVLSVPAAPDAVVTLPPATPRPGPRYVAVVEGTARGLVVRPVYVGRTDMFQDPRTTSPLLSIAALQQVLPRGAAVFSLAGNFLGIAIEGGSSTATVVPGDILRAAAESAREVEETRGDLGITVQPLTRALARATGAERGVVVNYVHPRGPAIDALESGDVVTAIDGTPVTTPSGFQQVVQGRTPGAEAIIEIVRRGKPLTVQVSVRDTTGIPLPPLPAEDPGLVLRAVPDLGAEVVTVRAGGSAARAGLLAGDIIIKVDGRYAPTPAALLSAYRQAEPGTALLLTVQRGADHRVFALER